MSWCISSRTRAGSALSTLFVESLSRYLLHNCRVAMDIPYEGLKTRTKSWLVRLFIAREGDQLANRDGR